MAQAIEVHVRAAIHRDEGFPPALLARDIALDACDGQCPCGLDHGAIVFEDVLNRGADFVRADRDHLIDDLAREPEGFLADPAHRDAVGEDADAIERYARALLKRTVHCIGIVRLDADDPDLREEIFHVRTDAGDQPSAAHGDEDCVDLIARALTQDLHSDRALSGDDVRIVERVDEGELAISSERERVVIGMIVVIAIEHGFPAEIDDGLHLDLRRRLRHHDRRRNASMSRSERDALRMIAGRRTNHAAPRCRLGQVRDLVIGAAELE